MVRGRSRRKRSPPSSPSKSLIARVSDGWATWHSSAARVKFSVRATARKYRTWCISMRTSPRTITKTGVLARFRTKIGLRQLPHVLQVRIHARDEASVSLEGNVTPRLIEGDRVDERLSFFVVALKYLPPMVPIAGCYAEIGG